MKKTAIVLAVLTASLFAVSCQKENNPEAIGFTPMTINAVSEGIGTATKTEMIYKYDIAWSANDKIYVTDGTANDTFTLSDGAGTTKGTFAQDGEVTFNNEVQAYYPSTLVQDDGSLVWPSTLTNNQTVPMYSTKTLSATEDETFSFSSLGSVFQLIFSTESKDVVLQSIELKADEAMSGVFTVNNGKAVMPTEGDKPGIKLDLGETGVALGVAAKKFNMAIPAGIYNNLTIILTAKDGRECEIKAKNAQTIEYNTVSTLTLSGKFGGSPIGGDILPGLFSISTNTKVHFTKGNLWADELNGLHFEPNQYEFNNIYEANHVSHFTWSSTVSDAVGESNNGDYLFCDKSHKVSVNGSDAIYYALSRDEWEYLFDDCDDTIDIREGKYKQCVTVCGKVNCVVLLPDDWKWGGSVGETWLDEYSEETAVKWSDMETNGAVCFAAAGARQESDIQDVGTGAYWSSSSFEEDETAAYVMGFYDAVFFPRIVAIRNAGVSIRLVTEVTE